MKKNGTTDQSDALILMHTYVYFSNTYYCILINIFSQKMFNKDMFDVDNAMDNVEFDIRTSLEGVNYFSGYKLCDVRPY